MMMTEKDFLELKSRLQSEVAYFYGVIPERVAIAWHGYLAALLDWNLISPGQHGELTGLLPDIPDNPVMAIFLGRDKKH
jgi:hypothetical protein